MKKIVIRKTETLKTTAAFYAGSCGPIFAQPQFRLGFIKHLRGIFMKKLTIRKAETLKTTAAFYAGGCGGPISPFPILEPQFVLIGTRV